MLYLETVKPESHYFSILCGGVTNYFPMKASTLQNENAFTRMTLIVEYQFWVYKIRMYFFLKWQGLKDLFLKRNLVIFVTCILPFQKISFNINWYEGWYFYLLVLFGSEFVSWIFIKKLQTFLEVKIEINRDNLTPCQAHWALQKDAPRWR